MKLHEYQAKDIFRKFGLAVPNGIVVNSAEEAVEAAKKLNGPPWIVKAQVHAGGRGKAGGVKLVRTPEELKTEAERILKNPLVTVQTGSQGIKVNQLLIEEGANIDRELYFAVTVDRSSKKPVGIFSQMGGMDIEEVADKSPELVLKQLIYPETGGQGFMARKLIYNLNPLPGKESIKALTSVMERLVAIFMAKDCSLVEINPLVITKSGEVVAIDAKMEIDDNALGRQKDLAELSDSSGEDPLDIKAQSYKLNYIRLDGNIGCMVNGAGLAMATMDVIKLAGASPANFLDVGGGASEEMITKAMEILLEDKNVKGIFVNIFGGILRCDLLARGIVAAAKAMDINLPLIIRLQGTNVEEGKQILNSSGLKFSLAETLADAEKLIKEQFVSKK